MKAIVFRALAVWLILIVAESIHGTLREFFLKPYIGDFRARQIAFFSGMALILTIALLFIRWLKTDSHQQLLKVGLLWMALTLVFEFSLGLFVLRYSWERMFSDYNLLKGGLMGFGLLFLVFAPLLAAFDV